MTIDLNVNRSASYIMKRPIVPNTEDTGLYLWLIIGCSLGGALLLTLAIAAFVYVRRRSRRKGSGQGHGQIGYIPGSEFCPQEMISSFSSSASDDTSESGHKGARSFRRPLGPSTSLDAPSLLRLTSEECVQPRPTLTRWHTVASPQTTPVLMDNTERDSDEEVPRSAPCLHGRLWFSLLYKSDTGQLLVTLHKAKYLPGRGLISSPRDPFVKVYLLPDEEKYHQSKIRKRTLNPKFNETFDFNVSLEDLRHRTLKLSVYDVDKRKVRHCLGHVMQPLDQLADFKGDVIHRDLEIAPQSCTTPGQIQLCMSCNPFSNRIKVTVCRIRNLHDLTGNNPAVFVRIELYHGRRMVKCKRTQSVSSSGTEEMVFDESFGFGVAGRFFDSCSLAFVVVQEGGSPLGRVVLGPFMYARGDPLQHWQEMLSNPRNTVTRWHYLEHSSSRKSS